MHVLVLRPIEGARRVASMLEMRGHRVTIAPLIEVVPLAGNVVWRKPPDFLVASSAHAFEATELWPAEIRTLPL